MKKKAVRVELVGLFPATVRVACLRAAAAAGLLPTVMLRTGRRHALLAGRGNETLYVRWTGKRFVRSSWTRDPTLFSDLWRSRTLTAAAVVMADPHVARSVIFLRVKEPVEEPQAA